MGQPWGQGGCFRFSDHGYSAPLLHIGYPKCLSTWFQRNLFIADHGFLRLMGNIEAHLTIIDPPQFGFEPKLIWRDMERRLAEGNCDPTLVPLVTSEVLSGNMFTGGHNAQQLADRLCQTFPEAKVLMIVREQHSMIRSLYTSWVAWGMPHSLERMLRPVNWRTAPQFNLGYLCYDRLVGYYQTHFSHERVLVLPFEQFLLHPSRFLSRIRDFVDIRESLTREPKQLPIRKRVNASGSLTNIRIQRLLNMAFVSGPFNYLGLFPDQGDRSFRRVRAFKRRERLIPSFLKSVGEDIFSERIQELTNGAFRDSNRILATLIDYDLEGLGYEL